MARPRSSPWFTGSCAATIALSLLVVPSHRAEGTALFSWNVPAGPHLCSPQVGDVTITPGSATSLGVVALGLTAPYHGYDIGIDVAPMLLGGFPDAWRFDTDGCQAGALSGPFYQPPP